MMEDSSYFVDSFKKEKNEMKRQKQVECVDE